MEEQKIEEKKWKKEKGAIFIPAGLFLGFVIGFAVNNIPTGLFIDFGAGSTAYTIDVPLLESVQLLC